MLVRETLKGLFNREYGTCRSLEIYVCGKYNHIDEKEEHGLDVEMQIDCAILIRNSGSLVAP